MLEGWKGSKGKQNPEIGSCVEQWSTLKLKEQIEGQVTGTHKNREGATEGLSQKLLGGHQETSVL